MLTPVVSLQISVSTIPAPVDGHDTEALLENLSALKAYSGPKLLHLITKKRQRLCACRDLTGIQPCTNKTRKAESQIPKPAIPRCLENGSRRKPPRTRAYSPSHPR
ncbi:MAG: 1-deoxy-D-xylulose-5-phosphate synthase N-terminal domain-containing protein [Candidatus Azotimanducaceae bacterium WSBS_2022_MAG_OTU7]